MPADDLDVIDDRPASVQAADTQVAETVPDAGANQTAQETQATPAPAAATTETSAAPVAGQQATPAAAAPATPSFANVREFAASLGVENARNYQDDHTFTQALINLAHQRGQQLQETQRMAQYGQLWLDAQSKQQQQAVAPQTPTDPFAAYKAPPFDPRWTTQISQDPATGEWKLAPGADPTILPKFHAHREYRERVANELLADPLGFIEKMSSGQIEKKTKELVEQRVQQIQQAQRIDTIISRNSDWAFVKAANGQRQFNMDGSPMLTQPGQRYKQFVEMTGKAGVVDPEWQDFFARNMLVAEMNATGQANQQAQQQGNQQRQALLNNMNRAPNASGSLASQDGVRAPAQQNTSLSLRDQLAAAFKAEGITDEMIAAEGR